MIVIILAVYFGATGVIPVPAAWLLGGAEVLQGGIQIIDEREEK